MKKKKKLLALILAMSFTTGCGNEIHYFDKDGIHVIEEHLSDVSVSRTGNFEKDQLTEEYICDSYLQFYKFLSEEYGKHLSIKKFNEILNYIDETVYVDDDSYKKGLMEVLFPTVHGVGSSFYQEFQRWFLLRQSYEFEPNKHFKELEALLLLSDETIYDAIFEGDMEKVMKIIADSVGSDDTEKVRELFDKMDALAEEERKDTEYREIQEQIKEILTGFVATKCKSDEKFAESFLGCVLSQDVYGVDFPQKNERCSVLYQKEGEIYSFSVPLELIKNENREYVIFYEATTNVLKQAYLDEYDDFLPLLSFIIDFHVLDECSDATYEDVKEIMYNHLEEYFSSRSEFHLFLLGLYNRQESAIKKYMDILKDKLMNNDYTLESNALFRHFMAFFGDHTTLDLGSYENNMKIYDALNMSKEECLSRYSTISQINFLFFDYSIEKDIKELRNYFYSDENPYLFLEDPYANCSKVDFTNGNVYLSNDTSVLSVSVEPKVGDFEGSTMVYYEIPLGYENCMAVKVFENIDYQLVASPVLGMPLELSSGDLIYVVSFDKVSNEEYGINNYGPVRFKKELYYLEYENTDKKVKRLDGREEA